MMGAPRRRDAWLIAAIAVAGLTSGDAAIACELTGQWDEVSSAPDRARLEFAADGTGTFVYVSGGEKFAEKIAWSLFDPEKATLVRKLAPEGAPVTRALLLRFLDEKGQMTVAELFLCGGRALVGIVTGEAIQYRKSK